MENGHGNIGIADVYRVVTDLQTAMTKVITHLERVDTRNEYADRLHVDFEARLRALEAHNLTQMRTDLTTVSTRTTSLEKYRYSLAGGLALLVILLSALGSWIAAVASAHH